MVTKPGNRFTPPPAASPKSSASLQTTFVDVDKLNAAEVSKLTVRLPKSLHKDVKARALAEDVSVQEFVQAAITEKLDGTPAS